MADTSPFLPSSQSDLDANSRHRKRKALLSSFFSGVFLVLLAVGFLVINNYDRDHEGVVLKDDYNQHQKNIKTENNSNGVEAEGFPWTENMLSWQRTAFHFQPEHNWMSDPSGPLYYKGWYHFFYQHNPNGPLWGHIAWGHAVSRDMIHWFHLPLALVPDHWFDIGGCFTGSITVLPNGKIIMLYTGGTAQFPPEQVQIQNLAWPEDENDPLLLKWKKYSGNPVLVRPPGILKMDFRDPTNVWNTSEGKWRFLIGSKWGTTGIIFIYETQDFINYELLPEYLHSVSGTGVWECVDLYPVSTIDEYALDISVINGPNMKHVLKASVEDVAHDYYAIGTYDDKNAKWIPDDPKIDVGLGNQYDYGAFYASRSFYDPEKRRRLVWGFVRESDSEAADVKKGWSTVQAMPRTISLDKKTGNYLLLWPVEEVESLRFSSQEFNNVEVKAGSIVPLDLEGATQLDIIAEFELDKNALESTTESDIKDISCGMNGGAAQRGVLGPFGLMVLADNSLSERTPVYFYVAKGYNGTLKTLFCMDQTWSSLATDVTKLIYGGYVPVLDGEKLTMRILVDHSIIEGYAQGGRACITARVYPTRAIYGAAKVFLFNDAHQATVTASVKIWQMNSAFIRPYSSE